MIRLEIAGAHTHMHSTLCSHCPQGKTGCCQSPPGVEWSDIGRIVALGGLEWLLEQLVAKNLRPGPRGLLIKRTEAHADGSPAKCIYHGDAGCILAPKRRAATCNYYLCEDAFAAGGYAEGNKEAQRCRKMLDALVDLYGRWDRELKERIEQKWPEGPSWCREFFAWLGEQFEELSRQRPLKLAEAGTGRAERKTNPGLA